MEANSFQEKTMEKKSVYMLCPRCELNYIEESEEYCTVCKAELGLIDASILIPEDDVDTGEKLCPVCKVNYIGEDEDMCFMCAKERENSEKAVESEQNDEWHDEFGQEEVDDDSDMVSLEEMEEEEFAEEEEENTESEPDDFDFAPVDPKDFEDEDEEEEEEDEDSDFDIKN